MTLLRVFLAVIILQGITTALLVISAIVENDRFVKRLAILWLVFGFFVIFILLIRWLPVAMR